MAADPGVEGSALRLSHRYEIEPQRRTRTASHQGRETDEGEEGENPGARRPGRLQALHAKDGEEETPGPYAEGVIRAERSSARTSARRRTSDLAVGSSPRARYTSTSVTIPITVE